MLVTEKASIWLLIIIAWALSPCQLAVAGDRAKFVVQLTRSSENFGHRRAFMQIDKVLEHLGVDEVEIVVVAYEEGVNALTVHNPQTEHLLVKLADRGVKFRACQISMKAWNLTTEDFPLEVKFVSAGAPEVIRLQMEGYRYWRP